MLPEDVAGICVDGNGVLAGFALFPDIAISLPFVGSSMLFVECIFYRIYI